VLDQLSRYSRHVYGFPCKHIDILPQEADERVFLFGLQGDPNASHLGLVTQDQFHLFGLLRLCSSTGGCLAWNLQIGRKDLLGIGDGLLHADQELEGFSGCVTLLLLVVSDEHIAP
jgi:hypothetical protein